MNTPHSVIQKAKLAVITGGASGIGLAIAAKLSRRGMNLVLFDKNKAALAAATEKLKSESSESVIQVLQGDVTAFESRFELLKLVRASGPISLLVNNAAILHRAGPWGNDQVWHNVMDVNFWSVLEMQRLFVSVMLEQAEKSAIVNVGSKEGITTPPGNAAYAVSKAAVRVLTEQLAHELRECVGEKISAHLLIPGFTFTPMNFPGMTPDTPKPQGAWEADQVADRMIEGMESGDFYIFCPDNEVTWELDQRRLQWSIDDMIKNRPALSRWHNAYAEQFRKYISRIGLDGVGS